MRTVNRVTLLGPLVGETVVDGSGAEPEARFVVLTRAWIAGEDYREERHAVVARGHLALWIARHVRRGEVLYVDGRLEPASASAPAHVFAREVVRTAAAAGRKDRDGTEPSPRGSLM